MPKYHVAIVGYGQVTPAHIKALQSVPSVEVVALVSLHLFDAGYNRENKFNGFDVFPDLSALLEADNDGAIKIDVVDICSKPDMHVAQAIQAANSGKHLIIEKPLALNFQDALKIKEAVEQANVQVCVCYECRFSSQAQTTQELLPHLGKIYSCHVSYFHSIGPDNPQFDWNTKQSQGGSSLLSAGCHALDLALFFMSKEVASVYCTSSCSTHSDYQAYEYPTAQVVTIKFTDGSYALCESDIGYAGKYYFPVHLRGEKGALLNNQLTTRVSNEVVSMKLLESGDPSDHPYPNQFKNYFDALDNNRPMQSTSLTDALRTHLVIAAAEVSLKQGREVFLSELIGIPAKLSSELFKKKTNETNESQRATSAHVELKSKL